MTDHHTRHRLQWLRNLQRVRIPEWVGGILAGLAFAALLNLFP